MEHVSILFEWFREFMFVCTTWQNFSNVIGLRFFSSLKSRICFYFFFATAYKDLLVLLRNTIHFPSTKVASCKKIRLVKNRLSRLKGFQLRDCWNQEWDSFFALFYWFRWKFLNIGVAVNTTEILKVAADRALKSAVRAYFYIVEWSWQGPAISNVEKNWIGGM